MRGLDGLPKTTSRHRQFIPSPFVAPMLTRSFAPILASLALTSPAAAQLAFFAGDSVPDTQVHIAPDPLDGNKAKFYINGELTYSELDVPQKSKGLLQNVRWVQATIDDLDGTTNPDWFPAGGTWDPQANTQRFINAMDEWKAYGVRAITVNFQGGCQCEGGPSGVELKGNNQSSLNNNPFGASGEQCFVDWDAGNPTQEAEYLRRMGSFIRAADDRGIVVILGLFYFGQDERLANDAAVQLATERTVQWVIENNFTNVVFEVANEFGINDWYEHSFLQDGQEDVLLDLIHELTNNDGIDDSPGFFTNPGWAVPTLPQGHALATGSRGGGELGFAYWVNNADFLLLHGNGLNTNGIENLVNATRTQFVNIFGAGQEYIKPVVFNEDPGLNDSALGIKVQNMQEAYDEDASWGLYWDSFHQSAPFEPEIADLVDPAGGMTALAEAYIETLGDPSVGNHYCRPATPNSTGNWAHLYTTGSEVVQDANFRLLATGLPKFSFGIFTVGDSQSSVMLSGSQGVLCNQSNQFGRFPEVIASGKAGCFAIDVDPSDLPIAPFGLAVQPGDTWNFQAWYRDANPQVTSNFTDAVEVTFL